MPPTPEPWQLILGLIVIILAIGAIARRLEVRLTLSLAGLLLATIAGTPFAVVQKFLATFADEKFVIPICTSMGFSQVLRLTGCDQHLVHLLVKPLMKVRMLLVPGTVVVGFFVNVPIVSQAGTAAALGPVIIPVLRSAGISPITTGASLLLGVSIGGELLNPGAPELQTIVDETAHLLGSENARLYDHPYCVARILPLLLLHLAVTTLLFWVTSQRFERQSTQLEPDANSAPDHFRVHLLLAAVPLLPIVLLYLSAPPLNLIRIPREWLGGSESRLIGAAMLLGSAVATLTQIRQAASAVHAFCEGAGYAFTHIISLITAANCFGQGLKEIGLATLLGRMLTHSPSWLLPSAILLPLGFGALCGSGMATTQSLFSFFAQPAIDAQLDPAQVGALVAIAAAGGRTISPFAAVSLMIATMTGTLPLQLARRIVFPMLISLVVLLLAAFLIVRPIEM